MRALKTTFLVLVPLTLGSIGCGGSVAQDNDAGVHGTGGSGTGGSPGSCDVVAATAAQVKTVTLCEDAIACTKVECKPALATCMGDSYESGVYAGKGCSDYANCVKACNCVSTCTANCALSQACSTCLSETLLVAVIQSDHCLGIAYQCQHTP